jgi:hypothetical protein
LGFDGLEMEFRHDPPDNQDEMRDLEGLLLSMVQKRQLSTEEQARQFWQALKSNFPAIKRVVLSENYARQLPFTYEEYLQEVIHTCPSEIEVYVSREEYEDEVHKTPGRSLYKLDGAQWSLVQTKWTRDRLILPPKRFSGYVGAFQQYFGGMTLS